MAKVSFRYPEVSRQNVFDLDSQMDIDKKQMNDKMRGSRVELDGDKHELLKVKTQNTVLEKKIEEAELEKKALTAKVSSLKVKLGLSNANLNTGTDDKETLRTNLNDAEILVARLEERSTAASTELDRMRDPANPDSNMRIRKHVVNDKKEIKRLRMEIVNEKVLLEADNEIVKLKETEIKRLEKELIDMKDNLHACETARMIAEEEEEGERQRREELLDAYKVIKEDNKTYAERIKNIKVKLGISVSAQNVNVKHVERMKKHEKDMTKQLALLEKKFKDTFGVLDILKNQHKLSKTALSINNSVKRTQAVRGVDKQKVSLAQSGPGPVKFATKTLKDSKPMSKSKSSIASSLDSKSRLSDGSKPRIGNAVNGVGKARDDGEVQKQTQLKPSRGSLTSNGATGKRNSVQFVPPPKSKLKQGTPR